MQWMALCFGQTLARNACLPHVLRDVSVVPRDVVRAGLRASERAERNLTVMHRILRRHRAQVAVISVANGDLVRHHLGFHAVRPFGALFWDADLRHVYPLPIVFCDLVAVGDTAPPWMFSCVGAKRPKSKAKPNAKNTFKAKPTRREHIQQPPRVMQLVEARLRMDPDAQYCLARAFRLFQCTKKQSFTLECGSPVCRMHMRTWRRHGLMTSRTLSASHRGDIVKYLASSSNPQQDLWYTRDIMWKEACVFGVDDLSDLSDDEYMECLRAVRDYWKQHVTRRNVRQIIRGSSPRDVTQRQTAVEDYVGDHIRAFKYFDARVFQEELRGLHPSATPSSASERVFSLALQYTNNRMANWSACRSLPIEEQYAGPQYVGHRLSQDRLEFVASAFRATHTHTHTRTHKHIYTHTHTHT